MTTQELISVHLGDGATPEEESLLSRELAANPAACREFVTAARIEGALHALVSGQQAEARLAACLEAAGVPSENSVSLSAPSAGRPHWPFLAAAALVVAAAWPAWHLIQQSSTARQAPKAARRPPALVTPTVPDSRAPERAPALPPPVAVWAARFYLTPVDYDNEPLDTVIEEVLAAVAEDNHLQRPELLGFELAWQPINVASASSPPKVTLHQSSLPLATALEWIAILSDCSVQWNDQGARLVETPPDPATETPVSRVVSLAEMPGAGAGAMPATAEAPAAPNPAGLLEAIGLVREHTRSARLDAAAGTLTLDLPEIHWARLQKIIALRDRAKAPPVTLTARLVEFAEPRETITEVLGPEQHRELTAALENQPGVASLHVPAARAPVGKPFQVERIVPASAPPAGGAPDWAGMRLTGEVRLAGEVVGVTAAVHLRLPPVRAARPGLESLGQSPPDFASLREYAADLEAYIPPGHTVVFAVTEKGAEHCLTLHLTAEPASGGEGAATTGSTFDEAPSEQASSAAAPATPSPTPEPPTDR